MKKLAVLLLVLFSISVLAPNCEAGIFSFLSKKSSKVQTSKKVYRAVKSSKVKSGGRKISCGGVSTLHMYKR